MSSHATAETLSAYLDRQLVEPEARQLEEHLGTCPDCHVRLEHLRKMVHTLQSLNQVEPPSTLHAAVARRVALADDRPDLLDRFEQSLSLLNRQNPILAMFGVVIALVLFIYLFSYTLHLRNERQNGTIPVIFQDPPAAGAQIPGDRIIVAGRTLMPGKDGLWVEEGVDASAVSRTLARDTAEGRAWLAEHPELADLGKIDPPVVIEVAGEVVRLE